jgi:hypothetical protein
MLQMVLTLHSPQLHRPAAAVALIKVVAAALPETAGLVVARDMTAQQEQAILHQHHRRKAIMAVGQLQPVCAVVAAVVALMPQVLLAQILAAATAALVQQ